METRDHNFWLFSDSQQRISTVHNLTSGEEGENKQHGCQADQQAYGANTPSVNNKSWKITYKVPKQQILSAGQSSIIIGKEGNIVTVSFNFTHGHKGDEEFNRQEAN